MWNEYRHLFVKMVVVSLITNGTVELKESWKKQKRTKPLWWDFQCLEVGEVDWWPMLLFVQDSINIIKLKVKRWFGLSHHFSESRGSLLTKLLPCTQKGSRELEENKTRIMKLSNSFVFVISHHFCDLTLGSNNRKVTFDNRTLLSGSEDNQSNRKFG